MSTPAQPTMGVMTDITLGHEFQSVYRPSNHGRTPRWPYAPRVRRCSTSSSPCTTRRPTWPCLRRLHGHLPASCPVRSGSPSPRTPAPTARPRIAARARRRAARHRACCCCREKGRGRALRTVWLRSDAAVLVYMDVDLSTDLAALLPLVAPLITGHSDLAIGTRLAALLPGGPRRQARGHLPRLQPDPARALATRLLRRPVRVQGDPRRRRRPAAAAGRGHRLVLRHRAAGAGRAQRAAHPRGPGRLGRRPRQPGRHRRDRPADLRGIARMLRGLATGRLPVDRAAAQLGRAARRPAPGLAAAPAGPVRRHRRAVHAGLPGAVRRCCAACSAPRRRTCRAAAHRGRQHRGQPAAHLRHPRRRRRGPRTSCEGLVVFGLGAGAHQRLARPCCTLSPTTRTACVELARAGRWPTCSPPCSASSCSAAGCSARSRTPADSDHAVPNDIATMTHLRRRHDPARTAAGRRPRPPGGPATAARSALGAPGPARAARRHRGALPVGPGRLGLGQRLLRRRGAGRHGELEGVALRLARTPATRSPSTSRPPRCG